MISQKENYTLVGDRKIVCSYCDNDLQGEEVSNPRIDELDNTPICDECWHDHFEFTCSLCQNYEDKEYEGVIGSIFVVKDDDLTVDYPRKPLKPGYYKIKSHPLYGGPLIGVQEIYENAIELIMAGGESCETFGCSCGFLCRDCTEKIFHQSKWYGRTIFAPWKKFRKWCRFQIDTIVDVFKKEDDTIC